VAPPAEEPPAGPAPLSAAWFRDHLTSYRDAAIDNPTPQNVAIYFHLQKIAMDRASAFAKVSERVVQADPYLDEITQRPTATFGANLVNRQAGEGLDQVLKEIAGMAAVWFFFRSDCPYCEAQAPLLEVLATRHGFTVLPVSIDGAPLPGGLFPNYRRDSGHAARLGVVSTPALFLVKPEGPTFAPIAQGLLSLTQLTDRITLAAVSQGWISEEALRRAQPIVADTSSSPGAPGGPLPEDPEALLALLRGLSQTAKPF
jgi:conjugal transfer pilus assembly protein TraF